MCLWRIRGKPGKAWSTAGQRECRPSQCALLRPQQEFGEICGLEPGAVAGELSFQEIHLVGENVLVGEVEKLVTVGYKWNRDQFHAGFFRGLVSLAMIAALAGGHHIGPAVGPIARY